jgi:hypothetical protein
MENANQTIMRSTVELFRNICRIEPIIPNIIGAVLCLFGLILLSDKTFYPQAIGYKEVLDCIFVFLMGLQVFFASGKSLLAPNAVLVAGIIGIECLKVGTTMPPFFSRHFMQTLMAMGIFGLIMTIIAIR